MADLPGAVVRLSIWCRIGRDGVCALSKGGVYILGEVANGGCGIQYVEQVMTLLDTDGRRLHALLVRLTLRVDVAEDLLQDLTLRLAGSEGFAGASKPYAYARTTATNLVMDWRRRNSARYRRESAIAKLEGVPAHPLVDLGQAELIDRMLDELTHLSERDRGLIVMRFMDAMGYEQIGEVIGKTGKQARGLCFHAVRRLRERMQDVIEEEGESTLTGIGGRS